MKKQYDILDEAIKLAYLNSDSLGEDSTNKILNDSFQTKMSDEQKNSMLNRLKEKHSISTLGLLITEKIEKEKLEFSSLSEKAHIPLDMLKKLASDEILVSSIPVRFMKNLLDSLDISFSKARKAILKTFETFNNEFSNQNGIAKPAFRKKKNRAIGNGNSSFKSSKNRTASMNEDKLNNYLTHLGELYQTDLNE